MINELVVLVDPHDCEIGQMEKMEAHRQALLHRAVSVFIFNSKGEWLLQRRALHKYHSNGLWTNTCCSHPAPMETSLGAAHRRLGEEMGMECPLNEVFCFTYKELLDNGLTEHELDHVFIGFSDGLPLINPDEVMEYRYVAFEELEAWLREQPCAFTVWFKAIYGRVKECLGRS